MTTISQRRGRSYDLAAHVAGALRARDHLAAHRRGELLERPERRTATARQRRVKREFRSARTELPRSPPPSRHPGGVSRPLRSSRWWRPCVLGVVGAALDGVPRRRGALRVGTGGALTLHVGLGHRCSSPPGKSESHREPCDVVGEGADSPHDGATFARASNGITLLVHHYSQ